jgi:small subunit ribosomal protein S8
VSMHDPVADMLTRIRNGQQANHQQVVLASSNLKEQIVRVLVEEGFVENYLIEEIGKNIKKMTIWLKYYKGRPVIDMIRRISKPGLRIYKSHAQLNPIPGFGIAIVSTSQGIMTHKSAKRKKLGGEVICEVA